jgi:glycosyltransferase involved in cell wall biosynthesis
MGKKVLHQVSEAALVGDATSDHVFMIRRWLREMGFASDVYSPHTQKELESEARRFTISALAGEEILVFHHTIGSTALDEVWEKRVPLILIYHNITPPEFFVGTDPVLTRQLERGREQLAKIRPITRLALAASPYSEIELKELDFADTGVLPIVLDEAIYDLPLDNRIQAECRARGPILLFVGRISPNKRQEDLIKLLFFYRRIEPEAHLVLIGGLQSKEYFSWLRQFALDLGLGSAITFAGHVSQQEMVTYYRTADLFVSMSEHEGFCKPLIESMHLGLPVLAYAATAVPSTMGGAGVLFHEKDYESLAEIVDILVQNQGLRQRIIAGQNERVKAFLEPNVRRIWAGYLEKLNLL